MNNLKTMKDFILERRDLTPEEEEENRKLFSDWKFHPGDFVYYRGMTCKVIEINPDGYLLDMNPFAGKHMKNQNAAYWRNRQRDQLKVPKEELDEKGVKKTR